MGQSLLGDQVLSLRLDCAAIVQEAAAGSQRLFRDQRLLMRLIVAA